jgi:N6-L-threonylcarbamoyladenine synthase
MGIPFVGINHLEGHIWANELAHPDLRPPFIALIASGGHTQLVHVREWGHYAVLGRTRDDAAGEAFDKVAKWLGLGFPGGPVIESLAAGGNAKFVRFPRAFLEEGSLDFSFSGLKTSVLNYVRSIGPAKTRQHLPDIAAAFQAAVIDVLIAKTLLAAKQTKAKCLCLSGGVAVNRVLQELLVERGRIENVQVLFPPPALCSDNAAMIARAGQFYLEQRRFSTLDLAPNPSLNL